MNIHKPSDADYAAIYHIVDRAFAPSISESNLVRDLRQKSKIAFDLVLEQQGRILAYICYSAAFDGNKTISGYHLAPLGVLPEKQRQGLGDQLTRRSLELLPKDLPVYVLGDPHYYKRFGFRIDSAQKCLFDHDGGHFMVLFSNPLPPRDVRYEEEFYELAGVENL